MADHTKVLHLPGVILNTFTKAQSREDSVSQSPPRVMLWSHNRILEPRNSIFLFHKAQVGVQVGACR